MRARAVGRRASRTLTSIRSDRDGLDEPLDVVCLRGEAITGIYDKKRERSKSMEH